MVKFTLRNKHFKCENTNFIREVNTFLSDENGINGNGNWVESQYIARLKKFGDFKAATHFEGGNRRPYMDFGISEITKNTITS